MTLNKTILLTAVSFSLLINGCGKQAGQMEQKPVITQESAEAAPMPQSSTSAMTSDKIVCIADGLSLKATPEKSGKWQASISFGEVVQFMGDSAKDSGDKDRGYYKIQLSDGKIGWAASFGLALNATPGVVKMETALYKRPDVVTVTTEKFAYMTILAVGQNKEGWVEVVGEGRKLSGWAKGDAISTDPSDVGAAILALKAFKDAKDTPRAEVIKQIIATTPYPQSFFIQKLQEEIGAAAVEVPAVPATTSEVGTEDAKADSTDAAGDEDGL